MTGERKKRVLPGRGGRKFDDILSGTRSCAANFYTQLWNLVYKVEVESRRCDAGCTGHQVADRNDCSVYRPTYAGARRQTLIQFRGLASCYTRVKCCLASGSI